MKISCLSLNMVFEYSNSVENAAKNSTPNMVTPANAPCRTNAKSDFIYSKVCAPPDLTISSSTDICSPTHHANIVKVDTKEVTEPTLRRLPCGNSGKNMGWLTAIEIKNIPTEEYSDPKPSSFLREDFLRKKSRKSWVPISPR